MCLTLKMSLKWTNNIRSWFFTSENIEIDTLRMDLTVMEAGLWQAYHTCTMAAIFDLVHTGHMGAWPLCFQRFFKTSDLYLPPCQTAKTCHKMLNCVNFAPFWGLIWPWNLFLTLKKSPKWPNDIKNGLLTPENIGIDILHAKNIKFIICLLCDGGHIWLVHTGHKGAWSLCLRWFLNSPHSSLSPCQVAKTCHKVRNSRKFQPAY